MSSVNTRVLKDQEDKDVVSHPCTFKEQPHCMWTRLGEIVRSRQERGLLLSAPTAQAGELLRTDFPIFSELSLYPSVLGLLRQQIPLS